MEVLGSSIGGGNIVIKKINGYAINVLGQSTTLLVFHRDIPGMISDVTRLLAIHDININRFSLQRDKKGGIAVMAIEIDGKIPDNVVEEVKHVHNVTEVVLLKMD